MTLRLFSIALALSCAVAPLRASTGINWFGTANVNSAPGYDAGVTFRGMADVNGDGRADYCRFVGGALVCGLSNGKTFNDRFRSAIGLDAGYDTFRQLADVTGDGKADYCRFAGLPDQIILSCAKARTGNFGAAQDGVFGANDVNAARPFDGGHTFRTLADVDGDGKADFCRFVGSGASEHLSCSKSTGTTFSGGDVNSPSSTTVGLPTFRAMADVNGDGKADYCRFYSNITGTFLACDLSTGTGFADRAFSSFSSIDFGDGTFFELGNGTFRALVDVNGDGRADFCRTIDPANQLVCALATPTGFPSNGDVVIGTASYDIGAPLFREMADVNGDGRADFVRFTGSGTAQILSAGLGAKALIVDTIPFTMSGETNQDSEPFLAVNPTDPTRMAASAFLVNPDSQATTAPILVTSDGGMSWAIVNTIPSDRRIGDITLAFTAGTASGPLYGGILSRPETPEYYRNLKGKLFDQTLANQVERANSDQPFVVANRKATNQLYVGVNDFDVKPRTATVDITTDGKKFTSVRIDTRTTTHPQDAPSIRPAYSPSDDVVYAAYIAYSSRIKKPFNGYTGNVVVVRDDPDPAATSRFASLKGSDKSPGAFVATNINDPFYELLGPGRLGSELSIAVDPHHNTTGTLYVAYCDRSGNDVNTLHVSVSKDKGASWSEVRTVHDSTVPSLAFSEDGSVVALLYQQLINGQWMTHFEQTKDEFKTIDDTVLNVAPKNVPAKQFSPYLGDYHFIIGVGKAFRGIFSASNAPSGFPSAIFYQRGVNATNGTLVKQDGTPVAISIDPFYFTIRQID